MKKTIQEDHLYAKNREGKVVYIGDEEVISGRKGYFCIACDREMQAKKGEKNAKHFAHDAKDIISKGKCTYSDESYRHKIGKEILQRIKQIKVPALYKYPLYGVDAMAMKIKSAEIIYADKVEIEMTFYEDGDGVIHFGRGELSSEKYLLIKPDVAFFDKSGNPILLIELVATHKIDEEKLAKIKRLGIDLVQVRVPKSSLEAIENIFYITDNTEWVYNYEQEQAKYIQPTDKHREGVLFPNEFQRGLLRAGESYNCRKAQINNLIRGIGKCLATEQYQRAERRLREEISRVEGNTEREEQELSGLKGKYAEELNREFEEEGNRLKSEEGEYESEYNDLEERYTNKKRELERGRREFRASCQDEIERLESELAKYTGYGESMGDRIEKDRSRAGADTRGYKQEREAEDRRINNIARRREELENEEREFAEKSRGELERRIRELKRKGDDEDRRDEDIRKRTIAKIDGNHTEETRVYIDTRINKLFEIEPVIVNIRERQSYFERLRGIKKLLDEGAFKKRL